MRIRTWLRERYHAWTITVREAVINDQQPSRLQLLLFLVYLIREKLAADRRRRAGDPAEAAIEFVETLLKPRLGSAGTRCLNNPAAKASEVRAALDDCAQSGTVLRTALDELYRRGAFHHEHDVAFAAIVIAREKMTLDEVAIALAKEYAQIDHRCDSVYPPS